MLYYYIHFTYILCLDQTYQKQYDPQMMRIPLLTILVVSLIGIFALIPSTFAEDDTSDQQNTEFTIPSWVKNIAGYWYDDKIPEHQFLGVVKYLIEKGIIILPSTYTEDAHSNEIPAWVKNNAGWWANDKIDDQTFVNGIQYLVKIGLIEIYGCSEVSSGDVECSTGGGGGGY